SPSTGRCIRAPECRPPESCATPTWHAALVAGSATRADRAPPRRFAAAQSRDTLACAEPLNPASPPGSASSLRLIERPHKINIYKHIILGHSYDLIAIPYMGASRFACLIGSDPSIPTLR